ncbi:MAG: SusC/RagA family TonB-linked outer membrane protein [Prevotella sp.]|nr:SusC/RagA family TonB-linked outer membrane protein [Prevotella sp.]
MKKNRNENGLLRRALWTMLFMLFSVGIYAQDITVRGTVTDPTGEPVIGATIKAQGTNLGTITNANGEFSLQVPANSQLTVSYVGFAPQTLTAAREMNIVLAEDATGLSEVVVTALGLKREQKALGYAMTELKGEDLDANLINPVQALQGKVAGVEITSSDGGMFGASKILIRGASTLNKNNQPIYVIDGVILDNGIVENDADWASGAQNYGNELKNLNPDDFETVSVLKGAAATALYGSRGLNGAVVITTKSGKGKRGLGIDFSQTFGFDKVTHQPKLQNEFAESFFYASNPKSGFLQNDLYWLNSDGYPSYKVLSSYKEMGTAFGPSFDFIKANAKDGLMEMYDGQLHTPGAYANNFKDAYDTGFSTNTNVAVSGGNDRTSFYTSLSYRYNNGTLPNNDFRRLSLLAKASHKITDNVELEASMTFANSKPRNAQPNIGENFINGTWDRMYDAKYYRDKYKGSHGGIANTSYGDEWGFVIGRDTWWSIWEDEYYQKETVVRPDLKLTWSFTPWLKWVTEANYNYYFMQGERKNPGQGYYNQGGRYSTSQTRKEQINLNTNLMFDKQLNEDWHLNGFLRYELYNGYQSYMSAETKGDFIVPNQYFLANGSEGYNASARVSDTKTIQSVAAQVGFSWKDQVYLDVTGRNDWSSALVYADGHGTFSYFYPSVNAAWLVTNSLRQQLPQWLSFWKLRASYAEVGNDCLPYYINSAYGLESYTNKYGKPFSTTVKNTTYSQNLKPERKRSWEIGTDIRFLNNRIGLDFTYYKENTVDQIMEVAIPSASGYSNALINAGNIQNSGVEIALNTTPVLTKDWQWDLNFTYTKNSSKIVELSDLCADYIRLQGTPDYGNYRIGSVAKVGGTYGMLMTDAAPLIDPVSGLQEFDLRYYNAGYYTPIVKRNGTVEEIGNSVPDFLGSINTTLRWKNWTLSASFDGRFGGKVASYGSHYGTAYGYTDASLAGREGHGGITFTSGFDGFEYHDGIIPNGIVKAGTQIVQPNGSMYTVGSGQYSSGETWAELVAAGHAEYVHASGWHYFYNSWGQAVVNDQWFKTLNYIAFRDLSLSYQFDSNIANKIGAKRLSLTAQAHNLGYLLNTMPNKENPEAVAGTTAAEFRIRQFSGVTTSFTFTLKATF